MIAYVLVMRVINSWFFQYMPKAISICCRKDRIYLNWQPRTYLFLFYTIHSFIRIFIFSMQRNRLASYLVSAWWFLLFCLLMIQRRYLLQSDILQMMEEESALNYQLDKMASKAVMLFFSILNKEAASLENQAYYAQRDIGSDARRFSYYNQQQIGALPSQPQYAITDNQEAWALIMDTYHACFFPHLAYFSSSFSLQPESSIGQPVILDNYCWHLSIYASALSSCIASIYLNLTYNLGLRQREMNKCSNGPNSSMPMPNPSQLQLKPTIVILDLLWNAPILKRRIDLPLDVVPSGKMTIGLQLQLSLLQSLIRASIFSIVEDLEDSLTLSRSITCILAARFLSTKFFEISALATNEIGCILPPQQQISNQFTWFDIIMGVLGPEKCSCSVTSQMVFTIGKRIFFIKNLSKFLCIFLRKFWENTNSIKVRNCMIPIVNLQGNLMKHPRIMAFQSHLLKSVRLIPFQLCVSSTSLIFRYFLNILLMMLQATKANTPHTITKPYRRISSHIQC